MGRNAFLDFLQVRLDLPVHLHRFDPLFLRGLPLVHSTPLSFFFHQGLIVVLVWKTFPGIIGESPYAVDVFKVVVGCVDEVDILVVF